MFGLIDIIILIILIVVFVKNAKKLQRSRLFWAFMGVVGFIIGFSLQFILVYYLDLIDTESNTLAHIFMSILPLCELVAGLTLLQILKHYQGANRSS